jgi:hypothetical protein
MKPSDLAQAIRHCADIQQPFFVWGDPGVGKSQIVQQVADYLFAKSFGYKVEVDGTLLYRGTKRKPEVGDNRVLPPVTIKPPDRRSWLIDLRAVLLDPVDLMGLPTIKDGLTSWAAPRILPRTGRGLLFFDELNRAPVMVQNACLQLVLDRRLGDYTLPDGWAIGSAGNFESEGGVQRMSDALRSRFTHLTAQVDLDDFCNHANRRSFHAAVVAFMRFRPELLHKYDKVMAKKENTFPCPRTWEFVSNILQGPTLLKAIQYGLIAGTVGESTANEFIAFLQLYNELPDMDLLVSQPKKAPIVTKPALCYAVASALARAAKNGNVANIIIYLDRMPEQEYAVLAVREMVSRDPKLEIHPAVTAWKVAHADVVF